MTDEEFTIHDRKTEGPGEETEGSASTTEGPASAGAAAGGSTGEADRETGGEEEAGGQRAGDGSQGRGWSRGMWSDAFADVQEIVNDVVENVRGFPLSGPRYPRMDLYRVGDEGYRVFVDLPGVGKDQVDVTTVGDELTIEGRRRRPEPEGAELLRSERGYGRFRRSLRMPPDVDPSGVRAEMHDGVLEIRLPREREAESRKVEID